MIHFKSKALQRWVVLIVVSLVGGMITKLPYLKDIYFQHCRLQPAQQKHSWDYCLPCMVL